MGEWHGNLFGLSERNGMMAKTAKPKGFKAFDALARKLVQVPKEEVSRAERKRKKRKRGK